VLQELRVENLLLIERAELRLAPGLNVLTGETGAGKTVLAHALDLLLGGRARPGIVRPGAKEAYVEGVFELDAGLRALLGDRLAADAEDLVLARRVGADGRTRAYLGGRSATVGELRDAAAGLLAFYGQHEHRRLTLAAAQLELLDGFCGPPQAERLRACVESWERSRRLGRHAQELEQLAAQRDRELDLLEFELGEIEAIAPDEREHEQLISERERLRRLDALCAAAGAAVEALVSEGEQPGSAQLLAGAAARLQALEGIDPALDALAQRMHALMIEAGELGAELRSYAEAAAGDGDAAGAARTLEQVEERLAALDRLARKHGGSIAAVLEFAEREAARRDQLTGAEGALAQAREQAQRAEAELHAHARALHAARAAACESFAAAVREQLAELALEEASFEVGLGECEPGPTGADAVEFLIAPNPGVPAGPVREIASGGELSRVMLAILVAGEGSSGQGTLVFDEIDAGIGGQTARAVGARLRELAQGRQVLCITHLPQVASVAERHFSITKETDGGSTRTSVSELDEPAVLSELVRMLGADGDDSGARRHARELRRAA
jgi:DNA repair protein RecN (Recombination protein N)